MKKQQLSAEQKRLETDLWIIALVTLGVFLFHAATGKQLMSFVANSNISVIPRLLLNPCVRRNINAVRRLLHAALLGVGIERGLGNTDFQNLRGFDDPIVLLKKQVKPVVGGHVITPFLLILYSRLARK